MGLFNWWRRLRQPQQLQDDLAYLSQRFPQDVPNILYTLDCKSHRQLAVTLVEYARRKECRAAAADFQCDTAIDLLALVFWLARHTDERSTLGQVLQRIITEDTFSYVRAPDHAQKEVAQQLRDTLLAKLNELEQTNEHRS